MPDRKADTITAHQVELAIGRLDSLSILPCVAVQLFPRLMQGQFSPSASADIIESDPALTARILSLIGKQGVSKAGERFSLRQGLDRLPAGLVRDALLSVRVFHPPQADDDNRKQLMLHSLTVACCAKDIAEITLPQMDSQTGLLCRLAARYWKICTRRSDAEKFRPNYRRSKIAKSMQQRYREKTPWHRAYTPRQTSGSKVVFS